MPETPRTPEPASSPGPTPGRPGAALALTGLVFAFIPCCPLTGLLGAFLGVFSLRRQRMRGVNDPTMRRVAAVAIIAGVAGSIVWTLVIDRYARNQAASHEAAMSNTVRQVIEAVAADTTMPDDAWAQSVRPDPDALNELSARIRDRYGDFDRLSIVSSSRRGTFMAPKIEVAAVFHFKEASPVGSARFTVFVRPMEWETIFRLEQLTIEDGEGGELRLVAGEQSP